MKKYSKNYVKSLVQQIELEVGRASTYRKELDKVRNDLQKVNQENARLKSDQVKIELEVKSNFEDFTFGPYDYSLRSVNVGNTVCLTVTHKGFEYQFEGFRYTARRPA